MAQNAGRFRMLSALCYTFAGTMALGGLLPLKFVVLGTLLMFAPDMVQRETKGDMDHAVGFVLAVGAALLIAAAWTAAFYFLKAGRYFARKLSA